MNKCIYLLLALGLCLGSVRCKNAKPVQQEVIFEKIDRAIEKGIQWLSQDADNLKVETFLLYSFLEKKFAAPAIFEKNYPAKFLTKKSIFHKKNYPFLRLAIPDLNIDAKDFQYVHSEMDRMTMLALWSDLFPIAEPETYLQEMSEYVKKGGYMMTHVLLAMQFLQENKRPICQTPLFKQVKTEAIRAIQDLLINRKETDDLWIEAMAFLLYTKEDDCLINDFDVLRLLDAQQETGGWVYDVFQNKEDEHTVILAIWALYEYRFKGAAYVNWANKGS